MGGGRQLGAASVQGSDAIRAVVEVGCEREADRQMGRTRTIGNGQDLGERKRWEFKMAPGEAYDVIRSPDCRGAQQA